MNKIRQPFNIMISEIHNSVGDDSFGHVMCDTPDIQFFVFKILTQECLSRSEKVCVVKYTTL